MTQSLQLQRGIDGSQGPCDGSPSHLWEDSRSCVEPKMKLLCDSVVQETPEIKDVWCLFFLTLPCRMHNGLLSDNIKTRETKQNLLKNLQFEASFQSTITR